ncbi:MAG: crossover junction endodeoxyribonuclease RuvC [Patescibacteria group bacterium]|nr:crossover junction endodeoxyribonuclease RuvC [Patescibacteria group bacterium]
MLILGIDPGTATTGWGILKASEVNGTLEAIEYDCISTPPEMPMHERLLKLKKELQELIKRFKPNCVAVEQLFFGVNSRTAMTVGQARGVVMVTVAENDVPFFEYQGLAVKQTLTGYGRADKKQMQAAVREKLAITEFIKPKNGFLDDAADALAIAICHVLKTKK